MADDSPVHLDNSWAANRIKVPKGVKSMFMWRVMRFVGLFSGFFLSAFAASTPAAAPAFSLAAGTYPTARTVTISDATARAAIYYTTTSINDPICPSDTTATMTNGVGGGFTKRTITAPGGNIAEDATSSVVGTNSASAALTSSGFWFMQMATFSAGSGTVVSPSVVPTLSGVTPASGSTLGGTEVTITGTKFAGLATVKFGFTAATNVVVVNSATIMATTPAGTAGTAAVTVTNSRGRVGILPGAFTYVVPVLPIPTFSVASGTYTTAQTVTISDATAGATIYYTTNGATPSTSSTKYTGAITVSATETIEAIAVAAGLTKSAVVIANYTIAPMLPTPTFSLPAGTYTSGQSVTISDATAGAAIYYTTNGTTPTISSTLYKRPVSVTSTTTLRAVAALPSGPASSVATAAYVITQPSSPIKTPNSSSTFFGMNINNLLNGTPWPNLPVRTIRLWDTQTLWGDLNSTRDTYKWQSLDSQINLARANNAGVIYAFGGVPPWALPTNVPVTSVTRSAGIVTVTTAVPHGLYYNSTLSAASQIMISVSKVSDGSFNGSFYLTGTPTANIFTYTQAGADGSSSSGAISAICSGLYAPTGCAEAPANLSDWDQYLTQLISHIGPRAIQYWELWNEPNIAEFWKGDPKILVAMAKDAQRIIKSVDPKAVILSPGVAGNYETQVQCGGNPKYCGSAWLSNWLGLGGTRYIDAVAFHGYPVTGEAPEQIQGSIDLVQATMAQHGVGCLPLWDTESSWGQNTALPAQSDQVGWLARHLLLEESMGVQRTIWYAYDSPSWGTLWKDTTDINAAGEAYGQLAKWLTGTTLTGPCAGSPNDATTFVCTYTRPNGYVAQAIWNTTSEKSLAVSKQFVQYRDLSGVVRSITGGTVEISTSPILLESSSAF
jgi:Chitobiase/beta-hexosaminidase C-terminal domain/IPT/TIG domain